MVRDDLDEEDIEEKLNGLNVVTPAAVALFPELLRRAPLEGVRDNRAVVIRAAIEDPSVFRCAAPELRGDKSVVMEVLSGVANHLAAGAVHRAAHERALAAMTPAERDKQRELDDLLFEESHERQAEQDVLEHEWLEEREASGAEDDVEDDQVLPSAPD